MRRLAKSTLVATIILIGFTISSAVAALESPCAGDCPLETPAGCSCSQAEEPIDYNQPGVDCPLPECCSGGHLLTGAAGVVDDSRLAQVDGKPIVVAPAATSVPHQAQVRCPVRAQMVPPPLISPRRTIVLQL